MTVYGFSIQMIANGYSSLQNASLLLKRPSTDRAPLSKITGVSHIGDYGKQLQCRMSHKTSPSSGPQYEPPVLTLEAAGFDETSILYVAPPARVMQPRALAPDMGLPAGAAGGPNPYVDYAIRYTAEGGIELSYKSDDLTFWRLLLRVLIGTVVLGAGSWIMSAAFAAADGCADIASCSFTTGQAHGGAIAFMVAGALLIWLVTRPFHAIHTIEVRPDCLILDDTDVFWAAHMEARPAFAADLLGTHTLKGIYGTRYVDFLSLQPVDDNDATPAVLARHIEDAFQQLWDRPAVWAGD